MNQIRTLLLLATLTASLLWAGHALGGQASLVFALLFAGLMTFGVRWFSDKTALPAYGLREISPDRRSRSARQAQTGWKA
ncbi:MAG: hypothetical protein JJE04_26520 [Acidobacteriia bacterium]|nr:hypothetical protein [Terriglobia bacterium]